MSTTLERDTNIKGLVLDVPPPTPELRFDLQIDITSDQWKKIEGVIKSDITRLKEVPAPEGISWEFLKSAGLIAPHIIQPLMDRDAWRKLRFALVRQGDRNQVLEQFIIAATARVIAPIFVKNEPLVSQDMWQWMSSWREGLVSSGQIFGNLAEIMLIDPEKAKEVVIEKQTIDDAKETVEGFKEFTQWPHLGNFLAVLKVAAPHLISNLNIDSWSWHRIFEDLKLCMSMAFDDARTSVNVNIRDAVKYAARLAVLAAQEVRVTDHGVELIMPQPPHQLIDEIKVPQTLKF